MTGSSEDTPTEQRSYCGIFGGFEAYRTATRDGARSCEGRSCSAAADVQ